MKYLFSILICSLIMSCSLITSDKAEVQSVYGAYKLKNIECIIPKDREAYCDKWKHIQVLNPSGKFAVNDKHAYVTWDENFDNYAAEGLKGFNITLRHKGVFAFRQNSDKGFTEFIINKNGTGEYTTDYITPHEGRVVLKYIIEKQLDTRNLKLNYPEISE